MNTRRLTKKYKHKSRSKKSRKSKRTRRRGRRVLKGGVPSVSRASSRSIRPSSGVVVRRTSGTSGASARPRPSSASIRPSSSAGISKHGDNFNFHDFYNKLMNTPNYELHSTLQDNKYMYIKNTTFQTFYPKGAYLNMNGLKFVNYLHGKFNIEHRERKNHLKSIISQLDQNGMAQALKPVDLQIIKHNISPEYFNLYEKLYDAIYKKLFPNGNPHKHHLSTSAIIYEKLPTVVETEEEDGMTHDDDDE